MRNIVSPLDGFASPFGGRRQFSPLSLDPVAFYDPSDTSTLFQDAAGTMPTGVGDPVGLVLDKSGNDNHLTAPSDAARPVYAVSESGDKLLQSDEVDDELSVTLPDLGTDVTIAYTTQSELRINEGETVGAGEYTLPQVDLLNYLMIDRQLTKSEKIELIRYLSRSAEGVNYGAVIDDMILACLNAVDVFIYDTTKDSDGGAWRTGALAQASSWYNETLNTATRGSRREFPAVAVIVAEATKVTIYDATDPALPMWMVFNQTVAPSLSLDFFRSGRNASCVYAINGQMCFGTKDNAVSGLCVVPFIKDDLAKYTDAPSECLSGKSIANRNLSVNMVGNSYPTIVQETVNDVAMTVLDDAPIDPATGLPVPTIACLVGETEVLMADGSTKRLDQVQPGEMVKTLEGEHKVLNWWDQDIKDVIELEFEGGHKIICTADHKIRTTEGWVEAGDLTEDHEVIAA